MLNKKMGKEVKLEYQQVEAQIKFLQGKILTVIESSITNEQQLDAVKSLINSNFSNTLTWVLQMCAPELPLLTREEMIARGEDVDKIESEAVVDSEE